MKFRTRTPRTPETMKLFWSTPTSITRSLFSPLQTTFFKLYFSISSLTQPDFFQSLLNIFKSDMDILKYCIDVLLDPDDEMDIHRLSIDKENQSTSSHNRYNSTIDLQSSPSIRRRAISLISQTNETDPQLYKYLLFQASSTKHNDYGILDMRKKLYTYLHSNEFLEILSHIELWNNVLTLPLLWMIFMSRNHDDEITKKPVDRTKHKKQISINNISFSSTLLLPNHSPFTGPYPICRTPSIHSSEYTPKNKRTHAKQSSQDDICINMTRMERPPLVTLNRTTSQSTSQSSKYQSRTLNLITTTPVRVSNVQINKYDTFNPKRHISISNGSNSKSNSKQTIEYIQHWKNEYNKTCSSCQQSCNEFILLITKQKGELFNILLSNAILAILITPVHGFSTIENINVKNIDYII
jgi:hypothetical protein